MVTKMAKMKPYLNIGPGEFIKEEMEVRNWTNEDLAQVLGLSTKTISELLNNKQRVTIDTAKILSKAFGQSPQYWLNLDNNYRLRLEENNNESEVEIKSKIYQIMPINDMIKKGWIRKYKDVDDLKKIFLSYWNLKELNFNWIDSLVSPNTRKSSAYTSFNDYYLLAWTWKAKSVSEEFQAGKFNTKYLTELAKKINEYTINDEGVENFIKELNNAGVKFFCLSHLPKTYLDGASFWHKNNPVIVYTKRYDRLDNFWFTIAHEIGHVLKHIKNENDIFVDDLKIEDKSNIEMEADNFAANILHVNEILDYFAEYKHYTSAYRVEKAAEELNINPAIIVGILKYYSILSYNRLNQFTEPVSDKIPKKYIVES